MEKNRKNFKIFFNNSINSTNDIPLSSSLLPAARLDPLPLVLLRPVRLHRRDGYSYSHEKYAQAEASTYKNVRKEEEKFCERGDRRADHVARVPVKLLNQRRNPLATMCPSVL